MPSLLFFVCLPTRIYLAEEDSAHLLVSSSAPVSYSDDTGRPDDTVVESISDDGVGVGNSGSSSSSSSFMRLSIATDMACGGVGGDIVPLAVLPPPSIEEQLSLVRVLRESSIELKPGQTRFIVAKRYGFVDWIEHAPTPDSKHYPPQTQ